MFPADITLHLTDECNLRCAYCFQKEKRPVYMSDAIARKAMDRLFTAEQEKVNVTFFGGEPLLCMDLIRKTVGYGKELEARTGKHVSYGITTNGTLFNSRFLEFCNQHRVRIHLSMDGDAETQDRFRRTKDGKPTSPILKEKMPLFLKLHRIPTVRMTVTPETAGFLYENVCYLLGIGFRNIAPIANYEADWTRKALTKLKEEWEKVGALYVQHALKDDVEKIHIKHLCDSMDFLQSARAKKHLCGAGRRMVAVDPTGSIFPCHRFVANTKLAKYSLGHIETHSELDLTEYSALTVKTMKGCKTDVPGLRTDSCSACQFAVHCSGGCIALNAAQTGSMYKPVPNNATFFSLYVDVAHRTQVVLDQCGVTHGSEREGCTN